MEHTLYSIVVSIAIVILSLAVAIIAVIKVKARHTHPSLMAGLNDLKKVANKVSNEGLTGRSIPITREEFAACRKYDTGVQKHQEYIPSYNEALLVEQINNSLVAATVNLNNASRLIVENDDEESRSQRVNLSIRENLTNNFNAANECYLNVLENAAYWHFKGFISLPVYMEMFLDITIPTYENVAMAKKYKNLTHVYNEYLTVYVDKSIRKKDN